MRSGGKALAALLLASLAASGCGRRGPPQSPLRILPGPPVVEPILQEGGEIVIRWTAPIADSEGFLRDLRLRWAVLEWRVVDLEERAAALRAANRPWAAVAPDEPPPEEEAVAETPDPETESLPEEETVAEPPDPDPESPPEKEAVAETPDPDPEPSPEEEAVAEPPDPETEPPPEEETAAEPPDPDPESPPEEETVAETPDPDPESPPEEETAAEPRALSLEYGEVEFELFEEIRSETAGESMSLRLPILEDWPGSRLEFRIHYESASGAGEPAEPLFVDVTGELPTVTGVAVQVEDGVVRVSWDDARETGPVAAAAIFSEPLFEVFRKEASSEQQEGAAPERIGTALGPAYGDRDVLWGKEVCYSARLVMTADEEERLIEDPGPEFDPEIPEQPPAASRTADWEPIPVRVASSGIGARSAGLRSQAVCVIPQDTFAPATPEDLRVVSGEESTNLSWLPVSASDLLGYHVYRAGPDGVFHRLTELPVPEADFRDSDRGEGTGYRYRVTAVDTAEPANESAPTEAVRARPW